MMERWNRARMRHLESWKSLSAKTPLCPFVSHPLQMTISLGDITVAIPQRKLQQRHDLLSQDTGEQPPLAAPYR